MPLAWSMVILAPEASAKLPVPLMVCTLGSRVPVSNAPPEATLIAPVTVRGCTSSRLPVPVTVTLVKLPPASTWLLLTVRLLGGA